MKIWQTWKSHDPTTFHPYYTYCHPSWQKLHPDWDYQLLDDDEILEYCNKYFPHIYDRFKNLKKGIYRADLIRYMIMFIDGGLYVDMDFLALKNHTPLWENAIENNTPIVFGQLNRKNHSHHIPNAWIMSVKPNELFWLLVLEMSVTLCEQSAYQVEACSGPILLLLAYNTYREYNGNVEELCYNFIKMFPNTNFNKSNIQLLNPITIYPCDWTYDIVLRHMRNWANKQLPHDIVQKVCKDSYAITFWAHNWN